MSHPLLAALQHSADVLQVVELLLQQLQAPLPQLALLLRRPLHLLLAAPRFLPQAAQHPAQVGQRHAPVGGTLLVLLHLKVATERQDSARMKFLISKPKVRPDHFRFSCKNRLFIRCFNRVFETAAVKMQFRPFCATNAGNPVPFFHVICVLQVNYSAFIIEAL